MFGNGTKTYGMYLPQYKSLNKFLPKSYHTHRYLSEINEKNVYKQMVQNNAQNVLIHTKLNLIKEII